jgi:hypothetical protein
VRELAFPADASVKALLAPVLTVATVGLQNVATAVCERYGSLAALDLHELRQPFVANVARVWFAPVHRLLPGIPQIAFGNDPKRANRRERATVVAVQLLSMIAIDHDLAFRSARQFEALDERVSRIDRAFGRIALPNVFVAVAEVILLALERA